MSDAEAKCDNSRLDALHQRLAEYSLGGHWQPRARPAPLVPHLWNWASIHECLIESGEVIELGDADLEALEALGYGGR